jgi:hypothetical protein
MFSVPALLDRAKSAAGVDSDYALAKLLETNKANVSNWRLGKVAPDERAILHLCQLSGDDPDYVAACVQVMRAGNDDAAALWRRVASRLSAGLVVSVVGFVLLAGFAPSPAMADSGDHSLYIMLTRVFLTRIT